MSKYVNESGFTALAGGERQVLGSSEEGCCCSIGDSGYWWTSTMISKDNVLARALDNFTDNLYRVESLMCSGFSVRCVKDPEEESENKLNIKNKVAVSKKSETAKSSSNETKKLKAVSYKELISKHFKSISDSRIGLFEKINPKKLNAFSINFDQAFWKKSTILVYLDDTVWGKGDDGYAIVENDKNLFLLVRQYLSNPEIYQLSQMPAFKKPLLLEVRETKKDKYVFIFKKAGSNDVVESNQFSASLNRIFITALNDLVKELKV